MTAPSPRVASVSQRSIGMIERLDATTRNARFGSTKHASRCAAPSTTGWSRKAPSVLGYVTTVTYPTTRVRSSGITSWSYQTPLQSSASPIPPMRSVPPVQYSIQGQRAAPYTITVEPAIKARQAVKAQPSAQHPVVTCQIRGKTGDP